MLVFFPTGLQILPTPIPMNLLVIFRAIGFMFQTTEHTQPERVDLYVDGNLYRVPVGISVAAALLLNDLVPFNRSSVDDTPRAPYCLMGVCSECRLEINGRRSQLSCQVMVEDAMTVKRISCQEIAAKDD